MAELGLGLLIVAVLLLTDADRLEWVATKLRDLIEWMTTD